MMDHTPDFADLARIEEELLVAKLKATRSALAHAGEKGRALEHEVTELLRSFLPAEYGLTTGFIVFHSKNGPTLSRQLDIIIYDAVRCSPLVRLETCDVLPLEAVYAYVEVKATLTSTSDKAEAPQSNSIEQCLTHNKALREMRDRRYWVVLGGSPMEKILRPHDWMSIRSYVIAFEPVGSVACDVEALAQRMADYSRNLGHRTHLHGLLIAGHGYFSTRPIDVSRAEDGDAHHIKYTSKNALLAFKANLLEALTSFPRPQQEWTPAVDQYFQEPPEWDIRAPAI